MSDSEKMLCFSAMVANGFNSSDKYIRIQSKYDFVIKLYVELYREYIDNEYTLTINSDTSIFKSEISHVNTYLTKFHELTPLLSNSKNLSAYLMGAFLLYGTAVNPEKDYRIEIVLSSHNVANLLKTSLFNEYSIEIKSYTKNDNCVIYANTKDSVEDILTLMNSTGSTLELIDIEIFKDMRNVANRRVNCDSANIDRVINSANKQTSDINFIIHHEGINYLPAKLKTVALLRLENPSANLNELCELLDNSITKSGLNRRFSRISEIASKLRNEYQTD